MKASELRIGNLVIVPNFNEVCIKCFVYDEIKFISGNDGRTQNIPIKEIEPIPLTEDWLLKFGFEQFDNQFDLRFKGFCISIYLYDTGKIVECYIENVGVDVYFVHQLQNLYFDLTGNELTIKQYLQNVLIKER